MVATIAPDEELVGYTMISENHVELIADRYLSGSVGEKDAVVAEIASNFSDPEWALVPLRVLGLMRDRLFFNDVADLASALLSRGGVTDGAIFGICWTACVAGHPDRVITYLDQAFDRGILDGDQILFLAIQHARLKDGEKARSLINFVYEKFDYLRQEVEIHRQFVKFYGNFGPDRAFGMFNHIERTFKSLGTDALEDEIGRALAERRPYLLLRLGDGEGSVTRVAESDTREYAAYYAANQREFLRIWFEDDSVIKNDRFQSIIDEFNAVIKHADAIGGIYEAAVTWEYRLGSRRGIAWVVNTMRKVLTLAEDRPDWAAQTSIHHLGVHYDLLLSGALARLLQGRKHIGVISCHAGLPAALKRTYDVGEVEFFKVPGEKSHSGTLGESAVEGAHWPDRFFELCETFDRRIDRRGQLFLVAAGMLGKIYASKLKAAGAVVLDIGAVADLWMGKVTRTFPHLPDELALRLKPDDALTVVQVGGMSDLSLGQQTQAAGGALIVFEPNPDRYGQTKAFFAEQGLQVTLIDKCLSASSGRKRFHIAKSLGCSSVLEPNDEILRRYSVGTAFRTVRSVDVDCIRYDELLAAGDVPAPDVLLISAQGFDGEVLGGFGDSLSSCVGLKIRTYLYNLYKNQILMPDIVKQLDRIGLALRRMVPNDNFDGSIVEVDAWFTPALHRLSSLSDERRWKLEALEHAWGLPSQRVMFSEGQFD